MKTQMFPLAGSFRHEFPEFGEITVHIRISGFVVFSAEFMDERTHQPGIGLIEFGNRVGTARCPVDLFTDPEEEFFDLIVQLRAIP